MINRPSERTTKTQSPSVRAVKRAIVGTLLVSSLSAPMLAQTKPQASPIAEKPKPEKKKNTSERKAEAEVLATFRALTDAFNRHDVEAFARFDADDFVFTEGGIQMSKQDTINGIKSDWASTPPGVKE